MTDTTEQFEEAARQLSLAETHRAAGALMDARDGLVVPRQYGDAAAEYEAVRGGGGAGAGLFDLSPRGRIEVSGKEAVQFLNGLVTNDVKALGAGRWMWAAFPNVQGRLLALARVLRLPSDDGEANFLFDTEAPTRETVFHALERFTLAGDFRVRDWSPETVQLSVQGARSSAIVGTALGGWDASALERDGVAVVSNTDFQRLTVARVTHTAEDGFDLICPANEAARLWQALVVAGARPCGYDVLELLRVETGWPRHGVDVTETNVVLESGVNEAISYTKGCYVGQEILARIHWRGHVAKRVAGLSLEDDQPLAPGAEIRSPDGKKIGRVTSSAVSPALGRTIALAMLKYDYLKAGTEVLIAPAEGAERGGARVVELPFVRGGWEAGAGVGAENAR
ncbi:MAG: aminomethyltransferase family protein [Pyrinomonadaceae bacterium]